MREEIRAHFARTDPKLFGFISDANEYVIEAAHPDTYFVKFCRDIVYQQLAGKAAHAIFSRFEGIFEKGEILPERVLKIDHESLRNVGLSNAKASYIRNIAEAFVNNPNVYKDLRRLEDEDVIQTLSSIKGIGRWTAEMFLMFTLGRENIFSHGDYGLRKGIMKVYAYKKEPKKSTIERIVKKWEPYKSYGSLVLWDAIDGKE